MPFQKTLFIVILAFCINISVDAQKSRWKKDYKGTYQDLVFKESIKDFEINTAPEKWSSEPVVILCQKVYVNYHYYDKSVESKIVSRKRILIQDKSGLDFYSQFHYQKAKEIGITIIKSDGRKKDIDIKKAIEVNSDIPKYQKNKYGSKNYFKIALPNLEVGDIIDYFAIYEEESKNILPVLIMTLSQDFPIINQEYIFDVHEHFTFYHNSFNEALSLVRVENKALDHKGRLRKKFRRLTLKDTNREANKNERWDFPYLTEPTIKIMVTDKKGVFGDKKNITKSNLDLNTSVPNLWAAECRICQAYKSGSGPYWKTLDLKKLPSAEKVDKIYNYLKYTYLFARLSGNNQEKIKEGNIYPFSHKFTDMRSDIFSKTFMLYLKKYNVEGEIVVVMPNRFGKIENAVSMSELEFGIYVPSNDKYYWTPNNFSQPGVMSPFFYGASGLRVGSKNIKKLKKKKANYTKFNFPTSKPSDHVIDSKIDLIIGQDNLLEITKNSKFSGSAKIDNNPQLLYNSIYAYEDVYALKREEHRERMALYYGKDNKVPTKGRRNKGLKEKKEKFEVVVSEIEKQRLDQLKTWVGDEYVVEEIKSFDINAFGNESADQALDVTMVFSSKDYLKKAGPNLLFDVGRLITAQVQLDPKEIAERTKPVHLRNARTILYEISFEVPEGMKAEGLNNLIMNVDNEAGSFVSSVNQEGQNITIKTSKIYKEQYLPLDKWPLLVDMLEAAYKFSQVKIVMKKDK